LGAGAAREARVGGGGRAGWRMMSAAARNKQIPTSDGALKYEYARCQVVLSQGISRSFVPSQVTASKSQWAACAPHLTSSFAVDLRSDGQKLTAYVQLLVRAKNQMKKRNKLVTLALHPGQDK